MTGRRRLSVAAGLCALGVVLGACSPSAPSQAAVTKALVASGYTRAEARCLSEAYERVLTDDELRDVAARGGGGVPVAKVSKLSQALTTCTTGDQPSATTSPPLPSTTAPAFGASTPSTTAPGFPASNGSAPSTSPTSSTSSTATTGVTAP